jgi:hypothetical protein
LDITQIFCEVDNFRQSFVKHWQEQPMLPSMLGERKSRSRMRLSEVMTIEIAFHGSGYKTFVDDRQPVPEMAQDLFGHCFVTVVISPKSCLRSSMNKLCN